MSRPARLGLALGLTLLTARALAGFTETAPADTFVLDESVSLSELRYRFDDSGRKTTLIDPVERFELGGGLQGVLTPNVLVRFLVMINQLQYGVFDNLTVAIGIPIVIYTDIDLDLQWTPGDYQPTLGRPYTEDDFWAWAGSLGQPKPEGGRSNQGVLSDIILGIRYRFSDDIPAVRGSGLDLAATLMGALPTGKQADPEELATTGTTMWDLHSQGELCFHLSADYEIGGPLAGRLRLGLDLFYEFLFEHEYTTPTGEKNPLLLSYAPYVGKTYTLDPGDFAGLALQLDAVLWQGPALATWLVDHDAAKAAGLPPILTAELRYTYTHLGQSDWESESAIWDWEREKLWLPGMKNTLWGRIKVSLLRLGVPAQIYFAYRNQSWLGGRNSRAADVFTSGLIIPARFW